MSNTFVQAKYTASGTGTLSSTPLSGDLIVVVASGTAGQGMTISDSQVNTWNTPALGGGITTGEMQAFWCQSNGAAGAYSFTVAHGGLVVAAEWALPAGWVLDTSTPITTGGSCGPGAVTFNSAAAGGLGVLMSVVLADCTVAFSGTGTAQRADDPGGQFIGIGDILSTASGSNLWSGGFDNCGCAGGTLATWALAFKAAPPVTPPAGRTNLEIATVTPVAY